MSYMIYTNARTDLKSKPVQAAANLLQRMKSVKRTLLLLLLLPTCRNAAVLSKATKIKFRTIMNLQVAAHQ